MISFSIITRQIGTSIIDISCIHCRNPNIILITSQKIFRILFIPLIPLKKYRYLICSNCNTEFYIGDFNYTLMNVSKIRTPWRYYLVLSSSIIIFLSFGIYYGDTKSEQKIKAKLENHLEYLEKPMPKDKIIFRDNEEPLCPFGIIKIAKLDNNLIRLIFSKHFFSHIESAKKIAEKENDNDFSDEVFEMSLEEFKKLDIVFIKR